MRKYRIIFFVAIPLLCIGLAVYWFLTSEKVDIVPIFQNEEVKFGMTQSELQSLLGTPEKMEENPSDTPNRVCSYQLPLLGQEASVDFWFHTEDGDKLWRIVVHWETDGQENAHRLQAHIKACLADELQPFGLTEDTAGQEVRFSLRRFSKDRIYSITVEDTSIQLICKIG